MSKRNNEKALLFVSDEKKRKVDFFISTSQGKTVTVGKKLLKRSEVISASRSIGQPTIDLRIEAFMRDNGEILDMLEYIKGMSGVRDAIWSEIIDVIGRKQVVVAPSSRLPPPLHYRRAIEN